MPRRRRRTFDETTADETLGHMTVEFCGEIQIHLMLQVDSSSRLMIVSIIKSLMEYRQIGII